MPIRSTHGSANSTLSLVPLGGGGLDEFTHESLMPLGRMRRMDNVRTADGAIERRKGEAKVWAFTDPSASKTFGADTKYGTIPAATHLEALDAGFALRLSFTAAWAGSGNTGFLVSSRVNGQSYHVLRVSMSDAGAVTVGFEKRSGGDCAVTTAALVDDAATHLLALFDPIGGTFTVYVNGASSGTPVTGLDVDDGPIAGALTAWHLGAHYNPATAGVVADTHFDGALQGLTLLSLRGQRAASGATTLVSTLLRHSGRLWPTPQAPNCLANYDMVNGSTTVLYDSSRYKNHGTLTGTPTNTAAVATASIPANFVGYVELPSNRGDNVIGTHGRLFHETIFAPV